MKNNFCYQVRMVDFFNAFWLTEDIFEFDEKACCEFLQNYTLFTIAGTDLSDREVEMFFDLYQISYNKISSFQ